MSNLTTEITTMSSLEISKLTDKDHKNVTRDIAKMLIELELDALKFEQTYTDSMNKIQKCYNLPKRECLGLISGYNLTLRMAIIDRWQELEADVKQLTPAEQMMAQAKFMLEQEKINAQIPLLVTKIDALEEQMDVELEASNTSTVKAYCSIRNIKCGLLESQRYSKAAAKRCRENDEVVGTQTHSRWGSVKVYPVYVLDIVLDNQ